MKSAKLHLTVFIQKLVFLNQQVVYNFCVEHKSIIPSFSFTYRHLSVKMITILEGG